MKYRVTEHMHQDIGGTDVRLTLEGGKGVDVTGSCNIVREVHVDTITKT